MGGLGNQLFQIFACIAYCLRHKLPFKLPEHKRDLKSAEGHERPTYWDTFLKRMKPFLLKEVSRDTPVYKETTFHYVPLQLVTNQNFIFYGFFNSYKYFEDKYFDIYKLLDISSLKNQTRENYSQYFNNPSISIHFRHGDYKNIQESHPILSNQFYINSLQNIINKTKKNDWTCLYFCEKDDNKAIQIKIKILKRRFKHLKFIKAHDKAEDWQQLLLMSCCKHNIIANSAFSWWGAYFNENTDKIVCYPDVWFGSKLAHNDTKDLFLDSWDKIHNS